MIILKNKLLLLLFFIASIVLISGFFTLTPTYIENNGNVRHFEDNDMSFDMASSWTVYDYDNPLKTPFLPNSPSTLLLNPGNNSQYSYYNGSISDLTSDGSVLNTSATNATDVVIVKTDITKLDSLPEGVTIDTAYKSDILYRLMNGTGDFKIDKQTTFDLNGKTAYQFEYTVSYITYQDTWIEHNGHYYRILSQAPSSVFNKASNEFNITLNSFKLK